MPGVLHGERRAGVPWVRTRARGYENARWTISAPRIDRRCWPWPRRPTSPVRARRRWISSRLLLYIGAHALCNFFGLGHDFTPLIRGRLGRIDHGHLGRDPVRIRYYLQFNGGYFDADTRLRCRLLTATLPLAHSYFAALSHSYLAD